MVKTLVLTLVLIIAVGGMIFLFSKLTSNAGIQKVTSKVADNSTNKLPNSLTQTAAVPNELSKEVPSGLLTKKELLEILEASISGLNSRVDDLSRKVSAQSVVSQTSQIAPTTSSTSGPKTIYIPVGFGGSGSATSDFGSISGQEVTIDTGNYAGYKQMVFEATFRIFQGNGTGEVRLFNKTDGTAILNSNLSTTSQDYVTKTSNSFTISTGSKTYNVQAKSSTGYSVDLQLSRIRVDF